MSTEYLDKTGLAYFWSKVKAWATGLFLTASSALDASKLTGTASVNTTGTASNVTGVVAIANGGTGESTRLDAVKALTNEKVGSSATHFLTITTNWAKAGYTALDDAKLALGLGTAAYEASSDFVHIAGAETVSGQKTFSSAIKCVADDVIQRTSSDAVSFVCGGLGSSYMRGAKLGVYGASHASYPGCFELDTGGTSKRVLLGKPDGTLTWDGNVIQTVSDSRLKTPLRSVPDEVLDAWEAVGWGQFQFLDAVERKGPGARLHLGLVAQRVKEVFEARGLDACGYGILCHEVRDAAGEDPASDVWMVRYAEALSMEACLQRRRADRLEARIAALETRG